MTDNGRSADPRKSSKVPTISTECRDFRRESVVCVLRVRGVFSRAGRRSRFTVSLAASAHRAAAQAAEVAEGRGGSVRICARRVAACERQHTQVSRPPRAGHVTRDGNRRITETGPQPDDALVETELLSRLSQFGRALMRCSETNGVLLPCPVSALDTLLGPASLGMMTTHRGKVLTD